MHLCLCTYVDTSKIYQALLPEISRCLTWASLLQALWAEGYLLVGLALEASTLHLYFQTITVVHFNRVRGILFLPL